MPIPQVVLLDSTFRRRSRGQIPGSSAHGVEDPRSKSAGRRIKSLLLSSFAAMLVSPEWAPDLTDCLFQTKPCKVLQVSGLLHICALTYAFNTSKNKITLISVPREINIVNVSETNQLLVVCHSRCTFRSFFTKVCQSKTGQTHACFCLLSQEPRLILPTIDLSFLLLEFPIAAANTPHDAALSKPWD